MSAAVCFGIPVLVFIPRLKNVTRDLAQRMVISTLVTWVVLVLYSWFIGLPIAGEVGETHSEAPLRLARMTILFYGWIPSVLGTAAAAGGYLVIRSVKTKRHAGP